MRELLKLNKLDLIKMKKKMVRMKRTVRKQVVREDKPPQEKSQEAGKGTLVRHQGS